MIFDKSRSPDSFFVYITLPGKTDPVVAGRFEVSHTSNGDVGRFIFGRGYVANPGAVAIDPVAINSVLQGKVYEQASGTGLFGAFRDSSPDFWGRTVINRVMGGECDEITYLLMSPDDRAGALSFGNGPVPPGYLPNFNTRLALPDLQRLANDIIDSDVDKHHVNDKLFLQMGTGMGGARPKATVEDDGALWLAKLNRNDDPYDMPKLEHSTLQLARECGISTADSKLVDVGGKSCILVRRFDRESAGDGHWYKHRMISALTALGGDDRDRSRWSYGLFADRIRASASDHKKDLADLFRRIAFNMATNNDDDHPRNHALIAVGNKWGLSPAYDLTPRPALTNSRYLAMSVSGDNRESTRENLLQDCGRFFLRREEAEAIADSVMQTVADRWYAICRKNGMSEADCERLAPAYENQNFAPISSLQS